MTTFTYGEKNYDVDSENFLISNNQWDENFAEGMAIQVNIPSGLTKEHWDLINSIRNIFKETGRCPTVFETCKSTNLTRKELKRLFPVGYLRGACKLAGVTYKEGYIGEEDYSEHMGNDLHAIAVDKTYKVDVRGFLVDPNEWDERYAAYRAYDMKIPGAKLTDRHWQIIRSLRKNYKKYHKILNVYEICEENQIDLEELERLFPDGYHRGAVKIAGLRVR